MAGAPRALEVRDLSFAYDHGATVLDRMSLDISSGERVALLGPNGAGKTTFALHLSGVLEKQEGSIAISGLELEDQNLNEIRRRVGMVFQNPDDQLFMPTVREDVAFGPANLKLTTEDVDRRVSDSLHAVDASGLAERTPHHLSGGEKRRAAIATALAMHPDMLVLDEPTSGLDPAGGRELAALLLSLEGTQLIITHDLPFALEVCPRSIIMSGGAVVADGPTQDLLANTDLLREHRLELPFGFDPRAIR